MMDQLIKGIIIAVRSMGLVSILESQETSMKVNE